MNEMLCNFQELTINEAMSIDGGTPISTMGHCFELAGSIILCFCGGPFGVVGAASLILAVIDFAEAEGW